MNLLCIGDSLTYGYGVARSESWIGLLKKETELSIINKGINGDTTSSMLERFSEDIVGFKPDKSIIMGGSNDFMLGLTPLYVFENLKLLAQESLSNGIEPILLSPPPMYKSMAISLWSSFTDYDEVNSKLSQLNTMLEQYCSSENINLISLYKYFIKLTQEFDSIYLDGVHLAPKGHRMIKDKIVESCCKNNIL